MAAEIVNLNKFRKAREKLEKERRAEENRVRFGRSRSDKNVDNVEERIRQRQLDGALRERGDKPDDGLPPDDAS